jgi:ParB family chromosome partitioning protein
MPKSSATPAPVILGRSQGPRPTVTPDAARHAEGERALQYALSVPIEQVVPDPDQPRKTFDAERLAELAASIAEHGILQPLLVRESGFLDDSRTRYMIVAGGRRYVAAQQAGVTRLPVIVRDTEQAEMRLLQLLENLQRQDLDTIEEARAMKEVQDHRHLSVRDLSAMLHRSLGYISERLSLLDYTEIEEAVATQKVTRSAAAEIARETDHAARRELLRMAQEHHLGRQAIQRLRREQREMVSSTPLRERTLRDVADELGATEEDIAEAARARKEEPELSPAEALTLAMMGSHVTTAGDATPAALPSLEHDESLQALIQDAGADVLIRFLEWIEETGVARVALLDYLRGLRNQPA